MTENIALEVGQKWVGGIRTKTITDVQDGLRIGYIDGNDGQEWYQMWPTFLKWIAGDEARLEAKGDD